MDKLSDNATLSYTDDQSHIDSLEKTKEAVERLIGLVGIFRRHYPIIVFIFACAIAFSLVYLFTTPKEFTAHTMFLIDTTRLKALLREPRLADVESIPLDDAQVETEIEVFKSHELGLSVIKDLKLTKNPEFVGTQSGFLGALIELVLSPFESPTASPQPVESEDALTKAALGQFLANRQIIRVGDTYVLDIAYTSTNADTAAAVANGIADAYLVGELDAKYQASERVSKWLLGRIAELRQQAMDADRAVLEFKQKNNIVDIGSGNGGNGTLLVDQRVVDLNAQLAKAHADTAGAKANLERIQVVMRGDITDAAVADSLKDTIITQLLTQYLQLQRTYNVYKAKYGATHLAVVSLQTQMAQLRQSMSGELARIAQSYQSDYAVAKAREESLEQSLAQQIAGSQHTKLDQLGLDELESKAKAVHADHDSFVRRYMEVTQQQSLPSTDARIITLATPPGQASSPVKSKVLLYSAMLGLMLGFAAAYLREATDNVFRTSKQVQQLLNTNCLTVLPATTAASASAVPSRNAQKSVLIIGRSAKEVSAETAGMYRKVIGEPLSSFAEGLRAVKVAADISGSIKQNKIIGVTSSLAGEGKSTVAANLAELIAHGGRKVILIDCDLRNPTLSRKLSPKADAGLLEVMTGKMRLQDAIHTDPASGLAFLPAVIESRLAHSSEILASDVFRRFLDGLREAYDYIIVDLSPMVPVVDPRATTSVVDSYVFVIQWGRTNIKLVQRQLASAPEIFDRLLGVVLNKASVSILDRYEDYYGRYYYNQKYYQRYGYTR